MRCNLLLLVGLAFATVLPAQPSADTGWFTQGRFGMFIHFGLYSLPAGVWEGEIMGRNMYAEWIQKQGNWPYGLSDSAYQALASQFNPTGFDADTWVHEAKQAGMTYLVITAKHHDGFALWPSAVSDFNIVAATPFGRDLLGELKAACTRHGLRLGFYYSHWLDWAHPGGARPPAASFHSLPPPVQPPEAAFQQYWSEKCLPQVQELMERYQPDLMWFDTWQASEHLTTARVDELIALVRRLDPQCLINSRIHAGDPAIGGKVDFLSMGDNSFPDVLIEQPWETSATMNLSWGYHQRDFNWRPVGALLDNLVANASRNGNLQLNVGPRGDGTFPPAAVRRLREVGAWLAVNAEGIKGAQPVDLPALPGAYVLSRERGGDSLRLYVYVRDWPADGRLYLRGLSENPYQVIEWETGRHLAYHPDHAGIVLDLSHPAPDPRMSLIVVDVPRRALSRR